jgi:DNA-binding LytR/AlgR family response regulator
MSVFNITRLSDFFLQVPPSVDFFCKTIENRDHVARMKVLSTDKERMEKLEAALAAAGVKVTDIPNLTLAPRSAPMPEQGIVLVYDDDHPEEVAGVLSSLQLQNTSCPREMIVGKQDQAYSIVPLREIQYFVAFGNYVYGQTSLGRIEINRKLFEIERDYKGSYFFRIHKSYVVNVRWVREIIPWFGGRLLLKIKETDEEIEVSRNYVKAFKQSLGI